MRHGRKLMRPGRGVSAGLAGTAIIVAAVVSVAPAEAVDGTTTLPTAGSSSGTAAAVNTAAPSIYGTATDAQTLTASTGTWSGAAPINYAYQWQDCDTAGANCTDIAGATDSSYTLLPGDDGSTIRVVVTASNAAGSADASSAPSAVVGEDQASVATPMLPHYDPALTADTSVATSQLTTDNAATARNLASADTRLAGIAALANTDVATLMASAATNSWTNMDGSKLLGATIYLPLPAPATITTDWPLVKYDPQELTTPPYTTGTLHFTASNVTALLLTVDLTRHTVVSIEPDANATISNTPPNAQTTPPPGGES